MEWKKRKWAMRAVFLAGFALCCFPLVSNMAEHKQQEKAVATYRQAVGRQGEDSLAGALDAAKEYNSMLYQSGGAAVDGMDAKLLGDGSYQRQLDISGTGVMGSLEIPKINVNLPIYHGTGETALSNGIGHIQGTSLPVGGNNTHCVLTGHRGLPSSKLLVRLDELEEGDLFFVRVCGQTLAYRVYEIETVEPSDVSGLKIQPDRDLMSIVTCTPYGINSKRLIVTGKRVEYNESEHVGIKPEIPSGRELILTALPFVFAALSIFLYIKDRRRSRKEEVKNDGGEKEEVRNDGGAKEEVRNDGGEKEEVRNDGGEKKEVKNDEEKKEEVKDDGEKIEEKKDGGEGYPGAEG